VDGHELALGEIIRLEKHSHLHLLVFTVWVSSSPQLFAGGSPGIQ
jgi:hypothetical protein